MLISALSRPTIPRRVGCPCRVRGFRPIGQPACRAELVTIGRDELETLQLADREGLYQEAAAERMGVSRQTFGRILARARSKVADCLIEGKVLVIEDGDAVNVPAPMSEAA
jgi:uncharacterized protein